MQSGLDIARIGHVARARTGEAGQGIGRTGKISEAVELANGVGVPLGAQRQRELEIRFHVPLVLRIHPETP